MIATTTDYEKGQEELRDLTDRLQQYHAAGAEGFTKGGVRKMIARLHEELAVYEGSEEIRRPDKKRSPMLSIESEVRGGGPFLFS